MRNMLKHMKNVWKDLNQPIFVGERLEKNLHILTTISIVTAVMGLVLIVVDILAGDKALLVASIATFLGGVSCAYLAGVRKNREAAGVIPTVFCMVAFTIYAITGIGNGTAIFWVLLMPIGISYFVGVKYDVLLSAYYAVLLCVLFYSPLRERIARYYSEAFMSRFPLLFMALAVFTLIAMVQYHRMALGEIRYTDRLNAEVERQTAMARERAGRLELMSEEMVRMLAVSIDAKDRYTNGHSFRVASYSAALARALGWSEEEVGTLWREALLHDIGKIGIPDAVLNKPGRLTDEEFAVIKSHAAIGGRILSNAHSLLEAADVARCHHERYDGRGYPAGLAGENIPLRARIVAVADAYDAMRSDRIYRKGLAPDVIRGELVRGRGTQFDPDLLDVFLRLADGGELDEIAASSSETLSGQFLLSEAGEVHV